MNLDGRQRGGRRVQEQGHDRVYPARATQDLVCAAGGRPPPPNGSRSYLMRMQGARQFRAPLPLPRVRCHESCNLKGLQHTFFDLSDLEHDGTAAYACVCLL